MTMLAAMPEIGSPSVGLALDAAERRAVRAFVDAGLIDQRYAGSLRARGQPPTWWAGVGS